MLDFIASGRVVDLALLLLAVEAGVLIVYRHRTGRGVAALDLIPGVAAGACLLLALRAALSDVSAVWIAVAMSAALPAHLYDLYRRGSRDPA